MSCFSNLFGEVYELVEGVLDIKLYHTHRKKYYRKILFHIHVNLQIIKADNEQVYFRTRYLLFNKH